MFRSYSQQIFAARTSINGVRRSAVGDPPPLIGPALSLGIGASVKSIKRRKAEEIVTNLQHVEVFCGQEMPRVDAIRQVQITEQTFYRRLKSAHGTKPGKTRSRIIISGPLFCHLGRQI
jgi:hypothetical protein